VQITVAEELGVGTRGGYYDQSGALRDMVQNHLFQLLSLTAMEPPAALDCDQYPRREGQDVQIDPSDPPQCGGRLHRARPNTPPAKRTGRRPPGNTKEKDVPAEFQDRDVRRAQAVHRQLALERDGRFIYAPENSCREA